MHVLLHEEWIVSHCIQLSPAFVDGEDGMHAISHIEVVLVDAVSDGQTKMLPRDELVEIGRKGRALEVVFEDLLDESHFGLRFSHIIGIYSTAKQSNS